MESSDSRKRPLDGESESGVTKRSNQGGVENVHLKILIPSIAAGAIIGKGGETITQIQKETGANIKMSKANDFYPGTTERVCLVSGSLDSVKQVHDFVMDKIREKPDPNPKPVDGETKINFERHKQVKILVPNSTAGMIIGKAGNFIRQIKEQSGAYVQISQKSKELSLPERCVTVAGENGDADQNRSAVEMVLNKIMEDPQSASCPNISYADFKGPVASSNPTGSPFAGPQGEGRMAAGMAGGGGGGVFGNIGNSLNNLNLNSQNAAAGQGGGGGVGNPALENLKGTLRGSGYSEQAVEEISTAMFTLANYGFLGLGLGLGGLGIGGGLGGLGLNQGQGNLTLANLAGILSGNAGAPNQQGNSLLGNNLGAGMNNNMGGGGGAMNQVPNGENPKSSVFGPVGSTTTTMAGGDTGEGSGSYFATPGNMSGDHFAGGGDSMFGNTFNNSNSGFPNNNGFSGQNQNSFGLGTGMGSFASGQGGQGQVNNGQQGGENEKKEVEVGEHIVGAILGPGGRGIVELQKLTGANIQISKKGVYSPGTRNRIVTLSGTASSIQRAQYMIQQRIAQEETKRARQGHNR